MAQVSHPIFGAIDPSTPGFWNAEVALRGQSITVDLTIDEPDLPASALAELPQSVNDIEPLDRAARAAILSDAQSGNSDSAAVLYLTHHHEVLSPENYQRCFGTKAPDFANPQLLLSRLALVRVGLYPEQDDRRILLDYSIDPDTTDYLLCVSFDSDEQPIAVDLES